jgi:hypothetical protein
MLNDHHRTTLGLKGTAIGRDNSTIDLEGAARTIDEALDCGDTAHIGPRAAHNVLAHDVKGEMRHKNGTASDGVVHEGDELIDKGISQDRATHEDKSHSEKYTMQTVNAGQDVSPHSLDGATRDLVGASHDIEATVNFDGAAQNCSEVTREIGASSVCLDEVDPYCPTQEHEVADDSLRDRESAAYDSHCAVLNAPAHKGKCSVQDVDDVLCGSAAHDGHGPTREKNGATRNGSVHDDDLSHGDCAAHAKNGQAQQGGTVRTISDSLRNENEADHIDSTKDNDGTAHTCSAREDRGAMHDDGGPVGHKIACDDTANDNDGSVCFKVELSNNFKLLATMIDNFYLDSSNPPRLGEKLPVHLVKVETPKNLFSYVYLAVLEPEGKVGSENVKFTDVNNCCFVKNSTKLTKSTWISINHLTELQIRSFDDHGFKLLQKMLDTLTYKREMIDMLAKVDDLLKKVNVLTVKPCWGWAATKQQFVNQFRPELIFSLQEKHEKSCLEGVGSKI